jgi:hypothetical protein
LENALAYTLIETGTKEKQIAQYEYFIDNNSGE